VETTTTLIHFEQIANSPNPNQLSWQTKASSKHEFWTMNMTWIKSYVKQCQN